MFSLHLGLYCRRNICVDWETLTPLARGFVAIAVAHGSIIVNYAYIVGRGTALSLSYDFLVIIGGTSGLTVPDRLAENPESTSFCGLVLLQHDDDKRSYVIVRKHRFLSLSMDISITKRRTFLFQGL